MNKTMLVSSIALAMSSLSVVVTLGSFTPLGAAVLARPAPDLTTTQSDSPTLERVTSNCTPATQEQAETLLSAIFSEMAVLDSAALGAEQGCMLEVEMQVISGDPATQGLVYVLPDGQSFLNGPLMDQQSLVNLAGAPPPVQSTVEPDPLAEDLGTLELLSQALIRSNDDPDIYPSGFMDEQMPGANIEASSSDVPKSDSDIDVTLFEIAALPNQMVYHAANPHPVYIVFDPQCSWCHELFKVQSEIAELHNARMVWIPTYLNARSREIAAHLVRVQQADPDAASVILSKLMTSATWDDEYMLDTYGPLDAAAYEQLDQSAEYLRSLLQQNGLGTPVAIFSHGPGANETTLVRGFDGVEQYKNLSRLNR